mmetsp:Transcript_48791/g.89990  ORF Transcript_48791/g.89990 Transcript_48791/m.89990 type:complete len:248 (-) Transcript_48791:78-821(-)
MVEFAGLALKGFFTSWNKLDGISVPSITILPPKNQCRLCSEFPCAKSKHSTTVGSLLRSSRKIFRYMSKSCSSNPRPFSWLSFSKAWRPSARTGTVVHGSGFPWDSKEVMPSGYTHSVMRSCTCCAKALISPLPFTKYLRERSMRVTLLRPMELQMDTALVDQAVVNCWRGPTSSTLLPFASWRKVWAAQRSGSKVSRKSHKSFSVSSVVKVDVASMLKQISLPSNSYPLAAALAFNAVLQWKSHSR